MTVKSTILDFNELTRLILREIDGALRLSRLSKSRDEKLHISHIKIKLGRVLPPSSKTHDGDSPVEGSGGEPLKPFLLLDHYPPAKQGWQFELDFSAGAAPPQVRRIDGVWYVIPPEPLRTADILFRTMPIRAMKGVSKWWEAKLGNVGISTVGMLMSLEQRELIDISQKTRSRYPLELFAKAQLLRVVVPEIPISKADVYSLFELIGKSATDLRELIGQKQISATASENLYWLISMLQIAMAGRVLRRILLKDLRRLPETA